MSKSSNPGAVVRKSPLKDSDDFKTLKGRRLTKKSASVLRSNLRKAPSNSCPIWDETQFMEIIHVPKLGRINEKQDDWTALFVYSVPTVVRRWS